ncbi:DUF3027 domain-containing protein [Microbacterium rhizophilus]|uniref:DUF3027 domain-containing protein n=1 Tax=Microbacterium rhizophilus TaxID=3138934 RepID=UPI0031EA60D4
MSDAPEPREGTEAETPEVEVAASPVAEAEVVDIEPVAAEPVVEEPVADAPEELPEPDRRLLEAHDLALAALHEITPASTVGPPAGHSVERGGAVSLRFENTLLGYPGWFWTVSLAVVEGSDPTVLEAELLPGDDALLAPEWVPWAVRLKEYQAAQAAAAAEAAALAAEDQGDEIEGDEEGDEIEDDDFDEDGSPILHAGDVDGVDIDTLDPDEDDSDDDESEDDYSDDESEDDDSDEDEDED